MIAQRDASRRDDDRPLASSLGVWSSSVVARGLTPIAPKSAPGEGYLLQPGVAELGVGAGHRPATAAPVEVAGGRVVEQRPHDKALGLAHVEGVAAALEQMLAQPETLVDRIEVELVDFALVGAAMACGAEGGVAHHLAVEVEHQGAFARADGTAPPLRRALPDVALKVHV